MSGSTRSVLRNFVTNVFKEPAILYYFPGTFHESRCVCATNEEITCQSSYDVCTTFNTGTLTVKSGSNKVPLRNFHYPLTQLFSTSHQSVTFINLLKPTGHVMHQQFNIQQLYALPTLYLCVLYLSQNKQRLVPLTA